MTLAAALLALWPWLAGVPVEPLRAVEVAAADFAVPLEMLAAVCWQESRLSLAPRYASLCGVRVGHRYVRDDGQSATIAARTLARSRARCGTWARAVADACVGRTRRAAADVLDIDLRTLYRWLPELRVVAPTLAARLDDRDATPVDR